MKKCSYCGTDYSDELDACPIDQTPFKDARVSGKSAILTDRIGRPGRWLIFSGIPFAGIAVLVVSALHHGLNQLPQIFGEKAAPFVVFFMPAFFIVSGMVLYNHFPKRLVIPCGMIGWTVGMVLICWYFWYGPGAFGQH